MSSIKLTLKCQVFSINLKQLNQSIIVLADFSNSVKPLLLSFMRTERLFLTVRSRVVPPHEQHSSAGQRSGIATQHN